LRNDSPDSLQRDPLLMDTLRDLRTAVNRVQTGQDEMRDRLYAMDDRLDVKLAEAVKPLVQRVGALEQGQEAFKLEVKRDARRWGAFGGASSVAAAIVTTVVGLLAKEYGHVGK
jgi:hypothetical protein